jgi:HK97 family phage prohead protease
MDFEKSIRDLFSSGKREDASRGDLRYKAFSPEIRTVDETKREITFVASTESVDRYGDIIRVAGWNLKNYKKNPVFLFGHRSSEPPIGKTVAISIEANPPALVQTIQFADKATYPFADTIFNLYKGKFMNAVSVGFRTLEPPNMIRDESGAITGMEFVGQELLELSAVVLPANTDAVARAHATDSGIISAEDLEKIFGAVRDGDRPATAADWAKLSAALERLQKKVDIAFGVDAPPPDKVIADVAELERLFRIE